MNIALIILGLLCVMAAAAIFFLANVIGAELARSERLEKQLRESREENARLRARLPVPAKPLYEAGGHYSNYFGAGHD